MLLQTITTENLVEIIEMNNGSISSAQLATILGKNHSDVTKKLVSQLGESTLRKLLSVEKYNNGKNERSVYLLPEKEAMALAMSYDMHLGMQVYEAYQTYKEALEKICKVDTLEHAQAIAELTLEIQFVKFMKTKPTRFGQRIRKFYDDATPLEAMEKLKQAYQELEITFSNDAKYRETFLRTWKRENRALAAKYLQSVVDTKSQLNTSYYDSFTTVENEIHKMELRIERRGRTVAEKQVKKLSELVQKEDSVEPIEEPKQEIELFDADAYIASLNQ
ncbi:hypothetical protein LDV99_001757 [Vibrio parahaemolyticus]|nr:hypothetical protein [Vibrio parahaemolyticus]